MASSVRRWRGPARRIARVGGPVLAGLLALACGQRGAPPVESVVLITVDTLRADVLGAYGGTVATPNVDRLAADGVRFEDAVAPMPLTKPSHFSLFTGRYPREHGVVNNQLALPDGETTLAEAFRDAGFRTAGFTGVALFEPASGVTQGFETYAGSEELHDPADAVIGRATDWLAGIGPEEPFFLWVHLYDPHMPYTPPAPFVPSTPRHALGVRDQATWTGLRTNARAHGGNVTRAAADRVRALYDGEVAFVDASLAPLLAALESRPGAGDTLVAFTADHGECFGHGLFYRHSDCLYEGALRVPLVVRAPGRLPAGEVVPETVELIDLGAALLRSAGVEPPPSFRARDLFAGSPEGDGRAYFQPILSDEGAAKTRSRIWSGIATVAGEPLLPALRSDGEPIGVRDGRWKYTIGGVHREELYDLAADPGERKNLAAEERRRTREMRALLRRFQEEHVFTVLDPEALDEDLREHLRGLGYL